MNTGRKSEYVEHKLSTAEAAKGIDSTALSNMSVCDDTRST